MSLEPSPAKKCKSNAAATTQVNEPPPQQQQQPPPELPQPTIDRWVEALPGAANDTNEDKNDQILILAQLNAEHEANIAEGVKQIAEQEAKIAELEAKIAELEAEKAERDKQKSKQNAEKEAKIAERVKKIAELDKQLFMNSVASMFYDKDSPSSNIKPSELFETRTSNSYSRHDDATADTNEFKVHYLKQVLSYELKEFDLKLEQKPSAYKAGYDGQTLASASDFRYCLNAIVRDAAKICNVMMNAIAKEHGIPQPKVLLDIQCASSWFTNVMDHVVVCDEETCTPILAVKPNTFSNEEQQDKLENGLDQLLAMKLTGHPIPFAAITNLTCTQITWLDTKVHREIVDDHNQKGFDLQRLLEIIQPTTTSGRQKKEQEDVDTKGREAKTTGRHPNDTNAFDGTICRSEVFSMDKIIDVLVNAIFCALHQYDRAQSVVALELEKMVQIDGTIGLTKEGHVRGNFHSVYKGPLTRKMRQESSSDTLYLVNFIRSGGTSKVYRAISESGHDCVIKRFVHCRETSIMSEEQFQKVSKKVADEEFANYEAIYGTDTLMDYMWRETLNNVHCIIMPLFRPIQMDMRNMIAVKDAIMLRLQQFGKAEKMFEPDDQSWRHIGYFQDELYLFDLGHLIDLDEPMETYISDHWQCLQDSAESPTER